MNRLHFTAIHAHVEPLPAARRLMREMECELISRRDRILALVLHKLGSPAGDQERDLRGTVHILDDDLRAPRLHSKPRRYIDTVRNREDPGRPGGRCGHGDAVWTRHRFAADS